MSKHENIKKEVEQLQHAAGNNAAIDAKLDELLALLAQSDIDSEKAKEVKQRLNDALPTADYRGQIDAFKQIKVSPLDDRASMLDEFSVMLASHEVDSKMAKKYLRGERIAKAVLSIIGLVLIMLGFAMIIMPAPPYFEMFTIFYFNPNDGVTLMDVISLLIILSGVYLLVKSIYKKLSTDN